jgi:hypothetical protein
MTTGVWGSQDLYTFGTWRYQGCGRLYFPGGIPGTHFCLRLSRPQGHSAVTRIKQMRNPNDPIGNRSLDLSACSAEPQPTAPPPISIKVWLHTFLTAALVEGCLAHVPAAFSPWKLGQVAIEQEDGWVQSQFGLLEQIKISFTGFDSQHRSSSP